MCLGLRLAEEPKRDGHFASRDLRLKSIKNWALRLPPYACPGDVLDRHELAVLDFFEELLDQSRVWRDRRVLVSGLSVVVHEGRIVLDSIVACEVIEAE